MVKTVIEIMEYRFLHMENLDILVFKNNKLYKYYKKVKFKNFDNFELWTHRFFLEDTLK